MENKRQMEEDEDRKREAMKKESSWSLLRESICFLKENGNKWQQRKILEVDRIKEEEKKDRLAICKEKKKKYGTKRMNKEENKRLKERTEERILISQAKANYWKEYRGRGGRMEGEDIENDATWKRLKDVIQVLEERGRWIEAEDALEEDVMMMGGAGDDGDERIDMTEAENNCKMTEGDNEVDIDGMLNECLDGRVGEKSKDDGLVDEVHDDQG